MKTKVNPYADQIKVLDRAFADYMGRSDFPCEHPSRDVVVDDGIVWMYCLDCGFNGWTNFETALILGWTEDIDENTRSYL